MEEILAAKVGLAVNRALDERLELLPYLKRAIKNSILSNLDKITDEEAREFYEKSQG